MGPKVYPKVLPFVFPWNFTRIMGCYVILYGKTQRQPLNRRNREFGLLLKHSCFLHDSIVSSIHTECCLTLLHTESLQFSSLSLAFIFSLGQLEPKFDDLPVTQQTSLFFLAFSGIAHTNSPKLQFFQHVVQSRSQVVCFIFSFQASYLGHLNANQNKELYVSNNVKTPYTT